MRRLSHGDAVFGGLPPEFTHFWLAVGSESTKIVLAHSKTFFKNPTLLQNCIVRVESESGQDTLKKLSSRGKFLSRIVYSMAQIANIQDFLCPGWIWILLKILCILHIWNFKFDLRNGFKFYENSNYQLWPDQPVHSRLSTPSVRSTHNGYHKHLCPAGRDVPRSKNK